MKLSLLLLTMAAAFALSWLTIRLRLRLAHVGLDRPNARSLHSRATPHGGGLGILLVLLAGGLWLGVPWPLLACVLALAALSFIDDVRHLPFWLRLAAHLAAAGTVCWSIRLPLVVWPAAVLAIGWMTNLYNFMDGADGLAGSQGMAGFAAYAGGFLLAGEATLALWCAMTVAACGGFLCFNWPPARIFMGDVGAIPLGFLAGALGLLGLHQGVWPGWFPLLAFAPFILDASLTLLRRLLTGQRIWEAHREHLYQRMVQKGWGHRGMTRRWALVMVAGSILALALLLQPAPVQTIAVLAWLTFLLGLGAWAGRGTCAP